MTTMQRTVALDALGAANDAGPRDYWALLKPRVMSLVVFTALIGFLAAPSGVHPVVAFASILCIAVGAGASGALNMWWDADIDAVMARTQRRPVPSGRVTPEEALGFGLGLSIISVVMLAVFANFFAAALLAFTIFFYAVIYTMWLKRSTPQNIVIGGAAGAFPPMIGWAVATGGVSVESILMFLVIFLWTPPHFWALALFRNDDYRQAGVPMLPVAAGDAATRKQMWLYTLILIPVTLAPAFTEIGGPVYLAAAIWFNVAFVSAAWVVARRDEAASAADKHRAEKKMFGVSIVFLFALFSALGVEAILRAVFGEYAAWLVLI